MQIDNSGVSLHVACDGPADGPTVVLLHGITSCTSTWDWLVPALADAHRVLRLDFRGHGSSDRSGSYHFPDYVSDAIAVCEQLCPGPSVLVGHSLGGGTAAAVAQQRPDLVRAVVLEDPALFGGSDASSEMETNALRDVFALMRQTIPMLQENGVTVDQLAAILTGSPATSGGTFGDLLHPDAITAMAVGMLHLDATVLDPVLDGSMVTVYDPRPRSRCRAWCWPPTRPSRTLSCVPRRSPSWPSGHPTSMSGW
jgi:esterase